jgi:3-oxoacyl-(acyl-carrier-protein) synthase
VRVVVTGLGAVSGFGRGVERLWTALLDGQRAMREQPQLTALGLRVGPVALVEALPLTAPSRAATLACWAAEEALADAGAVPRGPRLAVVCGTTLGGIASWLPLVRREVEAAAAPAPPDEATPLESPALAQSVGAVAAVPAVAQSVGAMAAVAAVAQLGDGVAYASPASAHLGGAMVKPILEMVEPIATALPSTDEQPQPLAARLRAPVGWSYAGPAQAVAAAVDARGPLVVPSVACASGNVALDAALALIRSGRCDVVLAGGADVLHDFVIQGFASLKALDPAPCRPFDRSRRGLNLGEAAAFLVLESEPHARARGARIRAFLDGTGVAADAVHMTGPDREGRGAARAMAAALADAGRDASAVDFVSAHGTATVFNDLMEGQALRLVLGARAGAVPVNSIKGALGHTLGAAAALEAIVCVRTLESGRIPPTAGLTEIDPQIALDVVHGAARSADVQVALSTSSGFGGTNGAVVLSRA